MEGLDLLGSFATTTTAVSIAAERFVAVVKTMFPSLTNEHKNPDGSTNLEDDKWRRLTIQGLAFLGGWLTASFFGDKYLFDPFGTMTISGLKIFIPVLGILASGGSALWTSVVSYASAARDIKVKDKSR